jgi:alpha-tubulin suppressor-like RCC1 family protein
MNVSNLIIRLQELASQSTDAFELMVLAKSIEKAKVGAVQTVATFGDLPTLPLAEDGELFLVEADEDLYFNVGSTWDRFRPFEFVSMSWGLNTFGQLGDGSAINRSSPVTVAGGITNWSEVSAGRQHGLGIADNIIYAWGVNSFAQIGDETTISKSSPVTVVGGITNWSQASAGGYHSLGVTSDGIAYAWGRGTSGRLGDGTTIDKSSPVTVVGGITNWSQVSAGNQHSLAIADGIAYAWGDGFFSGRLGDGESISKSSPVTVVGGITNWSQVSAGSNHSLGVTATGIAYAWGTGSLGRLGDGTTISRSSPVTVVGGITNWSQVSAGEEHSLGVTTSGIAYAWGYGGIGRLGDDATINRSSPVTVAGGITNWSQVSAGGLHSLGLTAGGIAYAWGFGNRLGDGTEFGKIAPVTIAGGINTWSSVSAGGDLSIAIKSQ